MCTFVHVGATTRLMWQCRWGEKRSCEENCTKDVMIYGAPFFLFFPPSGRCVFSDREVFFSSHRLICVRGWDSTHFTVYRQNRAAPTGRRKELGLLNDVSVWRGWVCWWRWWWWWWWRWGVGWVWRRGRRSMCGGGNTRSPTEMLNSITDWKEREEDSLQGWRKTFHF